MIPIFSESVLVLRVLAVYPPRSLSPLIRSAVYAPIIVIKLTRLANSITFAVRWVASARGDAASVLQAGQASWTGPFAKIEWFLALFDTSYVTSSQCIPTIVANILLDIDTPPSSFFFAFGKVPRMAHG